MASMLFKDITALTEEGKVFPHAYVAVEGCLITYVGLEPPCGEEGSLFTHAGLEAPSAGGGGQIEGAAPHFDRVYDGRGKLLMPALYNAHSHVPMTLLRDRGDNLTLERWLTEAIFPFEDCMTEEDSFHASMLGIAEMLRFGVVSFSDMYFHTEARARAVLETGIKANLSDCVACTDAGLKYSDLPKCSNNQRWLQEFHGAGEGRLLIDMSLHAEYTATPEIIESTSRAAKEAGLRMHVHVAETQKEVRDCIERHGTTPAQFLAKLGVFDVPAVADHCVWLTEEDRAVLAEKNVMIATCPASNAKLGSGIANVKAMKAAGITIALGTDGMASNNNHNMFKDLYLLALMQRAGDANPVLFSAEELVKIATRNGALSQGRNDCGMLAQDARADLVVLNIDTPWMQPVHSIAENLIYSAQGSDVVLTMVDGKILYENGEFSTIDIEKTIAQSCNARDKVLARMKAAKKGN